MKKNYFYISLLLLYILFLTKDSIFGLIDNQDNITRTVSTNLDNTIKMEYEDLLKITKLENTNYRIIYSKVLIRDIYDFYDKITISKGKKENIEKGNLVVSEKGVIGLINKSNINSSEVSLITNSNINLSVKINNAYGILTSANNEVIVKNIKLTEEIKIGDFVYTSGLTNIPENFLIGKVKEVSKDSLNLEYILKIELASEINHIRYVGVVK